MESFLLNGRTVSLRPITLDDVSPRYVAWLRDPEVNRYLETRLTEQTIETVRNFVERVMASADEHLFAICVDGEHVGNIKVGPIRAYHRLADVSLFVGERHAWGQGVATAAITLISRHAIRDLGLHKLHAGVYAPNVASAKAFLRAGYRQEGVRRRHCFLDNGPTDLLEFGLCADEMPGLPEHQS